MSSWLIWIKSFTIHLIKMDLLHQQSSNKVLLHLPEYMLLSNLCFREDPIPRFGDMAVLLDINSVLCSHSRHPNQRNLIPIYFGILFLLKLCLSNLFLKYSDLCKCYSYNTFRPQSLSNHYSY